MAVSSSRPCWAGPPSTPASGGPSWNGSPRASAARSRRSSEGSATMPRSDAVYARYSSHRQDDGTSIDVQLDACRRAAGGPLAEYIDRARTGRAIANREELRRLLDDAAAGRVGR